MRPELPRFDATSCQYLHVCASVDDAEARDLVQGLLGEPMIAGYNAAPGRVFARLTAPDDSSGAHFHVDLAVGKTFGRHKPRSTHRKSKLLATLGKLSDYEWQSRFSAFYTTTREIGMRFYSALGRTVDTSAETEVSLTGVVFSFRRAHLKRLSVQLLEKSAFVDMYGMMVSGPIVAEYLASAIEVFDAYFAAFSQGDEE